MNQVNIQPVFKDGQNIGSITSVFGFGMQHFVFRYEKMRQIRNWGNELDRIAENMIRPENSFVYFDWDAACEAINNTDNPELLLNRLDEFTEDDGIEVETLVERVRYNISLENLYIYANKQNQDGGYVYITSKQDDSQPCKPKLEPQTHYPQAVYDCGRTERFFYDYGCMIDGEYVQPVPLKKKQSEWPYYVLGDHLEVDIDLLDLYFDEVEWNELYWKLFDSIGRPWRSEKKIELWVNDPCGNAYDEKDLVPITEAQKVLFWCIGNEYTLDEVKEMADTGIIIEHNHLLTEWR